jgi:thymidylate kinase
LDDLEDRCSHRRVAAILEQHLPSVDLALFERCVRWLRRECGPIEHLALPLKVHRRLRPHARLPRLAALWAAASEKVLPERMSRWMTENRMRPSGGGTVVALIGGDGSGKTTCARELEHWLRADFATIRAQLGNPPRSLLSLFIGAALKMEGALKRLLRREPGTASDLELLRHVCTARDRFRLYRKVQRFTSDGGIAVCERYPVRELPSHVGPVIPALLGASPNGLRRAIRGFEAGYYRRMLRPDVILVLQLDPELAVFRKPGEPADYVRTRGRAVLENDWTRTVAQVVDAGRPLSEVLDDLKARVWQAL